MQRPEDVIRGWGVLSSGCPSSVWWLARMRSATYGGRIRYSVGMYNWLNKDFEKRVVCVAINRAVPHQLSSKSIMEGAISVLTNTVCGLLNSSGPRRSAQRCMICSQQNADKSTQRVDIARVCEVLHGDKLLVWRGVACVTVEQKEHVEVNDRVNY